MEGNVSLSVGGSPFFPVPKGPWASTGSRWGGKEAPSLPHTQKRNTGVGGGSWKQGLLRKRRGQVPHLPALEKDKFFKGPPPPPPPPSCCPAGDGGNQNLEAGGIFGTPEDRCSTVQLGKLRPRCPHLEADADTGGGQALTQPEDPDFQQDSPQRDGKRAATPSTVLP